MKFLFTLVIPIFLLIDTFAQRPETQNFHYYYPVNHPYNYLLIAPGTLGPKALPVPDVLAGEIGNDIHFKYTIENYFRKGGGDTGHLLNLNFRFPVVKNFMAFEFRWDLIDHFHTTNKIRDIYQVYKDDPGWISEVGDLVISTYLQLLKEKKFIPSAMFSSSFKTTSGSVENARYTDLPAHWHYLNFGKDLARLNNFSLRVNGMAGVYIWQTNQADLEQNEGFLWGAECQFSYKKLEMAFSTSGYNGWKWYGYDKPIILKGRIACKNKRFNYFAELKTGARDYYYNLINVGINLHFISPFELKRRSE